MKTLKRSAVLLLAAAMLLGCFTITAYATSTSYTGTYSGYSYTATLQAAPSRSTATIVYNNSGTLVSLEGSVKYYSSSNVYLDTHYLKSSGSSSTSDYISSVSNASYASGSCKFYIKGSIVKTLTV